MTQQPLRQPPPDLLYQLFIADRQLKHWINTELTSLNLSYPLWRLLSYLLRTESLSQTELSILLGIQKAPLGQQIDRLERDHWLQRKKNPLDKRSNRLFITEQGRQRFQPLVRHFQRKRQAWIAELGEEKWQKMQQSIGLLADHFCSEETLRALQQIQTRDAIHLVGLLARTAGKQLLEKTATLGFTRCQWLVFNHIAQHEGIAQRQIVDELGMQKAAVGQCLKELEQQQLIARETDETDRRINRLRLTEKARPIMAQAQGYYQQIAEQFQKPVTARQQRILKQGLELIYRPQTKSTDSNTAQRG